MKIAICDDREDDRGALKALLEAYGDFEIREYGSGKSLCGDMDYIRECGIVFLDINMDGMDGLDAARRIKAECPKVHIVLVTAYVNYALDGYKAQAVMMFMVRLPPRSDLAVPRYEVMMMPAKAADTAERM